MKVTDCIECPKCHKPFLKSCGANVKFGKEYFCYFCHEYFGVNELVNQWNYDAGDLFDPSPWWVEPDLATYIYDRIDCGNTFYMDGEPFWYSIGERVVDYQMVTRMLLDIPEIDDYADMIRTYADGLDAGIQ